MTLPRTTLVLIALGVAVAVGSAGCTGSDDPAPGGAAVSSGASAGGGSTVTPEQSRDLVVAALADTGRNLTRLGAAGNATGGYKDCVDQGGSVQYVADARIDPTTPAAPGDDLGARWEPGLAAAGWVLDPDPTSAPSGNTTRRGLKADLTVRLTSYRDQPFALLQILGPCLEVGDKDSGYTARGAEKLPFA
jgi:hypothetical protein